MRETAQQQPDAGASTLFVCVTCRRAGDIQSEDAPRAGARLKDAIETALGNETRGIDVVPVECLSNCTRSCTVAVTAPGKWTYVIGEIDPQSGADDVVAFARLHLAHEQGMPVWRERPQHVRKNTIARVPPLPVLPSPSEPAAE